MPYRHGVKLSGSYTIPWDIQVNAALQSYDGPIRGTYWDIGAATTYARRTASAPAAAPGQLVIPNLVTAPTTAGTLRLALQAPGTDYYGRQNQLDLGFRKLFRFGRYQYSAQADLFNFTNNGYVKTETRSDRHQPRQPDVESPAAHASAGGADAVLAARALRLGPGGWGQFPQPLSSSLSALLSPRPLASSPLQNS